MTLTAFVALYAAGLATFASPCVLPMLPLYLSALAGAESTGAGSEASHRRLRLAGIGFAVGLGLVFVLLGMGFHTLTHALRGQGRWFEIGAGVLMMLFGLKLIGWLRLPGLDREARPLLHRVPNLGGFVGGLVFGAGFAVGWTPCVGPVLATALTYAASTTAHPVIAGSMLATYALGLATPLVIASFAASRILVWVKQLRRFTPALQRVTGAALVLFGGYFAIGNAVSISTVPKSEVADCSGKAACETSLSPETAPLAVDQLPQGPALVEFVSTNCTICKRMHPLISELEQRCAPGLLVRINVDDPAGKRLAAHYGIGVVPTFVSIDHAGSEVERIVGEQTRQRLVLAISDVQGRPCESGG